MKTFERLESEVRSYCRSFPTVFQNASGHLLVDEQGEEYIDFFAGAGALNYGHNPEPLKTRLVEYLSQNGVTHSLDMATGEKRRFLEALEGVIFQPRGMQYKVMFPGPTGTNSVEAALKLARKVTGRHNIVSFTNGFHGMTLGSLALTGNRSKRNGAGIPLGNATHMPFCDYYGPETDTIAILEQQLDDNSSGLDRPAAFIIETVQAEGGVNVASRRWLQHLEQVARRHDILLIVDDIQVGCGRTGGFFSFESAGITPDIVCLSKSLSGYGLPFSVTLMRPELDVWDPGEHNGTFRGHNLAFVTATAALEHYWRNDELSRQVQRHSKRIRDVLLDLADEYDAEVRGRGMIQGIEFRDPELANAVSREAFRRGLVIETAGPRDEVLKALPPLTIPEEALNDGLDIVQEAVHDVIGSGRRVAADVGKR
jgi:diaminobutyrate-2-oxoglutarate transaminase